MRTYQRYAVYFTPTGALAEAGAAWLGWDITTGTAVPRPDLPGLDLARITERPRKYGFHGTIKPPFVLADGTDVAGLDAALAAVCEEIAPVEPNRLELVNLGPFLALKPVGDQTALAELAAQVVMKLDPFGAPPDEAELSRRRQSHLTPKQEQNLQTWGYPHVMDQFRFHMTLTGRVSRAEEPAIRAALNSHFAQQLIDPVAVNTLTLAGQASDGMFRQIKRFELLG